MATDRSLELWAGVECTIARIGDDYRDQVRETGHGERLDDLDRIAALGIRTLRYPVLWETVAPDAPRDCDWSWHDARMTRLRDLGIRPILGLVHHGSGPRYTHLLDRDFPRLLARHAERVARRYPDVDLYTPVNEPLTTARFSALYGHWYPHARDLGGFLRALANQCRATVLAMRAIRRINPAARLLQTEDVGHIFSTPALGYQAEHENERRWLSFDLLFGRVDRRHPWWRILRDHGVPERDLAAFLEGEARPDMIGVNHYLTSDRFLDERIGRYPAHLAGGNGRDVYADVEAVRVPLPAGEVGPAARLMEVWRRYGTPMAVTEVHHGCTRDEQLRWLAEVWRAAEAGRAGGADIRAVTIWAMFGAVDWNSLLTRRAGIYEPGPFDRRGPAPRATALAAAAASLARTGRFDHPVLDRPGWWRRDGRFHHPAPPTGRTPRARSPRLIQVVGPDGPLRRALGRIADMRGLDIELVGPSPAAKTPSGLARDRVWAVVDVGGRPGGDLASLCLGRGLPYLRLAPARTRPGPAGRPLVERDTAAEAGAGGLVLLTGPLFGPWEADDLIVPMAEALAAGAPAAAGAPVAAGAPAAAADRLVSPTYLPDAVHVALDLLIDGETGLRHLVNPVARPHAELVRMLADRLGVPVHAGADGWVPPASPALATERGDLLPYLGSALDRWLRDRDDRRQAGAMAAE